MPRSDTSPLPSTPGGRTDNTSPGNPYPTPYRARRIAGFVIGAAGFAAAVAGGWSWALAIVLWIAAVLLIAVRPSPEERVAIGLGAIGDIDKMKAGEWACWVQWDGSDFAVFDSMEAAKTMAQGLVQINEPPASAEASTLPGPIHCFEALIWPNIGAIPVRSWVWNQEAGDWVETWSGSASAAGAAAAIRKAARERQAAAAAAAAAAASTTYHSSSWP